MGIINNISNKYEILDKGDREKEVNIDKLKDSYKGKVPLDYIEILREATEIHIDVAGEGYVYIWGAEWCLTMNEIYYIQEGIPNSIAVAGDTGGGCLIYMEGKEGHGVYYVRYGDLDIDVAVYVAPTLKEMLINDVGLEVVKGI